MKSHFVGRNTRIGVFDFVISDLCWQKWKKEGGATMRIRSLGSHHLDLYKRPSSVSEDNQLGHFTTRRKVLLTTKMAAKLIILTFVLLLAVQIFGYPAQMYPGQAYPYLYQPNGINYAFPSVPSTNYLGGYGSTWERAVAEQLLFR